MTEPTKPTKRRRGVGDHVWVIGKIFGDDSREEPTMAFRSEAEAKQAVELLQSQGPTRIYITKVPVWKRA